jgi:hypothetical protein
MNLANLQLSSEEMRLVRDAETILTKNSVLFKVVGLMGELSGRYRDSWTAAAARAGFSGGDGFSGADAGHAGFPGAVIAGIDPGNAKISRGENYRGLPWVMLDYPRVFGREDVLAIRTFFWWGHSFSVTLHLKGSYLRLCLPVIRSRRLELAAAGFQLGISDDEWRHEHTPEVFRPMGDVRQMGDGGQIGDVGRQMGEAGQQIGDVGRQIGDAEKQLSDAGQIGDGGQQLFDAVLGAGDFLKLSAAVGLDRWADAPDGLTDLFEVLVGVLLR